jgi:nucleoside-diphosphate-sugar epimerase
MKTILITGGAGFLGSHLCERLLSDQTSVVCVDNYFTGSKANIRHLLGYTNFKASLDWAPKVSLDDGLKETIQYFRHLFDNHLA